MCEMIKELSRKPKKEIERIRLELNLTDDEEEVFKFAIRNKSAQEIALKTNISTRTVFRRLSEINAKLEEFYFYENEYEPIH